MKLQLENERFAPSGGIDGRAARRAMGKPDMQFWELFLRETLQNSWDAKLPTASSIAFGVEAMMFTASQAQILRDVVFADVPESLQPFRDRLADKRVKALVVSDERTRGLGGTTRADVASSEGESRDFVDFLRNVGRASTKALGGGTYGFGKGVLYDASSVHTCVVYSQTLIDGTLTNRLIASSVKGQYEALGDRFTGRHWWGIAAADGVVDPLTGFEARSIAESLGLATMAASSTGTSIAVLEPYAEADGDGDAQPVIDQIAIAASRWAWPHMIDMGNGPSIEFRFRAFGESVGAPDPMTDPVLKHFARAYEQAVIAEGDPEFVDQWPWTSQPIKMLRPIRHLGTMTYRRFQPEDDSAFAEYRSHIALMRNPRFIVKYLRVPDDVSGMATAGAFVVTPDLNDEFAKTEPVAHDDWVPGGGRSNPVKVALAKIKDQFKARSLTPLQGAGGEHSAGVAQVSRLLGSVLSGVSGSGAEIRARASKRANGVAPGRGLVTIALDPDPILSIQDGSVVADFSFTIRSGAGVSASGFVFEAASKVVLDGNAVEDEDQRPLGETGPQVVGWYSDGARVSSTTDANASLFNRGTHFVRVRQPPRTAITVALSVRATG